MTASAKERAAARLVLQKRQPSPEILAYRRELERLCDAVVESDNGYGFSAWLAAGCPREGEALEVGKPMPVLEAGVQVKLVDGHLYRTMTPNEARFPEWGTAAAWDRQPDGWLKYPERLFDEDGNPVGVEWHNTQGRCERVSDLWRHVWVGDRSKS